MRQFSSMMIAFVAVTMMLAPQTASADLDDVLGDIEWGDDRDEVVEKLRAEKLDELREDPELRRDRSAMQTARQRALDRIRQIEDTYTELRGDSTGFEISVISDEFTTDNDESMLRVRDDVAQKFYFFLEDEFYKLVIAYDEGHIDGFGFGTFVDEVANEYGSPTSRDFTEGRAIWENSGYNLVVKDQLDYFNTFTMTFNDRDRVEGLEAENQVFGGRDDGQQESGVSQRVQDVTGFSEDGSDGSVVDDITGDSVDVELSDDEQEEAEEEETATAAAQESSESADGGDDEPTARTGGGDTGSSADEDDDDDDGQDLVIY